MVSIPVDLLESCKACLPQVPGEQVSWGWVMGRPGLGCRVSPAADQDMWLVFCSTVTAGIWPTTCTVSGHPWLNGLCAQAHLDPV